jgi:hypothetical protein
MTRYVASLLATILLVGSVGPRSDSQAQFKKLNPEWAASGDPCWDTARIKAWIKTNHGSDAPWITCKKVFIKTSWEIRESVSHHMGVNKVDAAFACSIPGYLSRNYDQKKRSELSDFYIGSFPVNADIEILRLSAEIIAFNQMSKRTKVFRVGPSDILYDRDEPGGLGMKWRRDLLDWQFWVAGPPFGLPDGFIPSPYTTVAGYSLLQDYGVVFEPQVVNFPSWEEIRPAVEKQDVWRRTIPISRHETNLLGEVRDLKGRVTVEVDFAEQEREEWRVTVAGSERDAADALLPGPKIDGRPGPDLPLNVRFDWTMEGKFEILKRKGVRTYDTGLIVRYVQSPSILGPPPDVYRCELAAVNGVKTWEQTGAVAGMYLEGAVQGEAVKLKWFPLAARARVIAIPKKTSGAAAIQKVFGSDQFTDAVGAMSVPLRDGASVKGGLGDRLEFTITLSKVR